MLKGTRAAEYDQKCVSTRDWTMLVRKLRLAIGPGKERLLLLAIYMVVEMKIGGGLFTYLVFGWKPPHPRDSDWPDREEQ